MIYLSRSCAIGLVVVFASGCVGISSNIEYHDTLESSKINNTPGSLRYSVHDGGELSGSVVLALRQEKTCEKSKRSILNRKEVTVRKVQPGDKWKIPVLYVVGVVGTSLLVTGLSMEGQFSRDLSEEEQASSENSDADSEFTAKGGLTVVGAVGTPFLPWAIIESARTADKERDLGPVVMEESLGSEDCEQGPVLNEKVYLGKYSSLVVQSAPITIQATSNRAGNIVVPVRDLITTFCPDAEDSQYFIQFSDGSAADVTTYIHPHCLETNRVAHMAREAAAREEAISGAEERLKKLQEVVSSNTDAGYFHLASLLISTAPITDGQKQQHEELCTQIVDRGLQEAKTALKRKELQSARTIVDDLVYRSCSQHHTAERNRAIVGLLSEVEKKEQQEERRADKLKKLGAKKAEAEQLANAAPEEGETGDVDISWSRGGVDDFWTTVTGEYETSNDEFEDRRREREARAKKREALKATYSFEVSNVEISAYDFKRHRFIVSLPGLLPTPGGGDRYFSFQSVATSRGDPTEVVMWAMQNQDRLRGPKVIVRIRNEDEAQEWKANNRSVSAEFSGCRVGNEWQIGHTVYSISGIYLRGCKVTFVGPDGVIGKVKL